MSEYVFSNAHVCEPDNLEAQVYKYEGSWYAALHVGGARLAWGNPRPADLRAIADGLRQGADEIEAEERLRAESALAEGTDEDEKCRELVTVEAG